MHGAHPTHDQLPDKRQVRKNTMMLSRIYVSGGRHAKALLPGLRSLANIDIPGGKQQLRSIASTSPVLTPKQSRASRRRQRRREEQEARNAPKPPTVKDLRAELEKLNAEASAQNETKAREDAGIYEDAPKMPQAPYPPTLESSDVNGKIQIMFDNLLKKITTMDDEEKQKSVLDDIYLIRKGDITREEFRTVLQIAAHSFGTDELKNLRMKLSDRYQEIYGGIDHYKQSMDDIFSLKGVSPETQRQIGEAAFSIVSSEFSTKGERIEKRIFEEFPQDRDEYIREKGSLRLHQKLSPMFRDGQGVSMLPTIPRESTLIVMPVTEDDWPRMKIGELVSFVKEKADGNVVSATKRITALAGDVVEYKGPEALKYGNIGA